MKNNGVKIIISMLIWGSLGIFVKNINLGSQEIAFSRAVIGSIFIFIVNKLVWKNSISSLFEKRNRKTLYILMILGLLLGLNWILLFESYKYTTVGNGTLTYYLAPAFTILLAPFITKEKIKIRSLASVLLAIIGLFLILITNRNSVTGEYNHVKGIMFALGAAIIYALIVLINKKFTEVNDIIRTLAQMIISAISLLPIILSRGEFHIENSKSLLLLIFVGVLHTGVAYMLYFSSFKEVSTDKIAVLSYIDPISSVIFGVLFLSEAISINTIIGGMLILSSSLLSRELKRGESVEKTI